MGNYRDEISQEAKFNACSKEHYASWLGDPSFNVAMTLNFNASFRIKNATDRIQVLFGKVDRELLGSRFNTFKSGRMEGVFFFENVKSNTHVHGLIQVRPDRLEKFITLFPTDGRGLWSDVWRAGTQKTKLAYDPAGWARYITKEQTSSSAPETMVILSSFYAKRG